MRQVLFGTLGALLFIGCGGGAQTTQSPADSTGDEQATASPAGAETDPGTGMGSGTDATSDSSEASSGGGGDGDTFQLSDSDTAGDAHGASESKIKPTDSEAAMKFVVIDKKNKKPIEGIVIKMTSPEGDEYYTKETDAKGYAEVLVPVGHKYELEYLSLGRRDVKAKVDVPDEPNQNIKLTLRYKGWKPKTPGSSSSSGAFILTGVTFDTGKATIKPESHKRLAGVVEFMKHKKSARVEISGHTDNVGSAAANKKLSQRRAKAVRKYLISKGIDASRIEAVGYGAEKPVASNDTPAGRQKNRRIEAKEL